MRLSPTLRHALSPPPPVLEAASGWGSAGKRFFDQSSTPPPIGPLAALEQQGSLRWPLGTFQFDLRPGGVLESCASTHHHRPSSAACALPHRIAAAQPASIRAPSATSAARRRVHRRHPAGRRRRARAPPRPPPVLFELRAHCATAEFSSNCALQCRLLASASASEALRCAAAARARRADAAAARGNPAPPRSAARRHRLARASPPTVGNIALPSLHVPAQPWGAAATRRRHRRHRVRPSPRPPHAPAPQTSPRAPHGSTRLGQAPDAIASRPPRPRWPRRDRQPPAHACRSRRRLLDRTRICSSAAACAAAAWVRPARAMRALWRSL